MLIDTIHTLLHQPTSAPASISNCPGLQPG